MAALTRLTTRTVPTIAGSIATLDRSSRFAGRHLGFAARESRVTWA
jgi:hypothetical protein